MESSRKIGSRLKNYGLFAGLATLCMFVMCCGLIFSSDGTTTSDSTQVSESNTSPTVTPQPSTPTAALQPPTPTTVPQLAFADIVQHPNQKNWSQTQYTAYFETLEGKFISGWVGTVIEVDEYAGKPYLSLDIESGKPEIDAYIYIKKDDLLKVSLGQNVTFSGTIDKNWHEGGGYYALQIEDITLLEVSEAPTATPTTEPTAEPTIATTSTPTANTTQAVLTSDSNINIRSGPGTNYPVIDSLTEGQTLQITGRNADSSWWQVALTSGGTGWIAASVTEATSTQNIPIAEAPPAPPTATPAPQSIPPTLTPTSPPPVATCNCSGDTYNCSDFSGHFSAQACFEYCISQGRGDIHRLDKDNDGLVCE